MQPNQRDNTGPDAVAPALGRLVRGVIGAASIGLVACVAQLAIWSLVVFTDTHRVPATDGVGPVPMVVGPGSAPVSITDGGTEVAVTSDALAVASALADADTEGADWVTGDVEPMEPSEHAALMQRTLEYGSAICVLAVVLIVPLVLTGSVVGSIVEPAAAPRLIGAGITATFLVPLVIPFRALTGAAFSGGQVTWVQLVESAASTATTGSFLDPALWRALLVPFGAAVLLALVAINFHAAFSLRLHRARLAEQVDPRVAREAARIAAAGPGMAGGRSVADIEQLLKRGAKEEPEPGSRPRRATSVDPGELPRRLI